MGAKPQEPAVEPVELTIEERLENLEKSARRWRFISLALFLGLAGLAGYSTWAQVRIPHVVRARRLEIIHDKGVALELASSPEGDGHFELFNAIGTPRVKIGNSRRNAGTIETYSGHEQKLISIGGSGSGGQVAVFNSSGHKVVDVQSSKTNCGALAVNNFDGEFREGIWGDRR